MNKNIQIMLSFIKYLSFITIFFVIFNEINGFRLLSENDQGNPGDFLDISRTELSKILGKKRIRTNRKFVPRNTNYKNINETPNIPG